MFKNINEQDRIGSISRSQGHHITMCSRIGGLRPLGPQEVSFMEAMYILRHFLATLKYRCSKAILNIPEFYSDFEVGSGVRKPVEILSHISFVLRCAQSVFDNNIELNVDLSSWDDEVNRFYKELNKLDHYFYNGLPDRERIVEKLLQGPLSDAMTHVGQLSIIRRLAGDPLKGENFFNAEIRIQEVL